MPRRLLARLSQGRDLDAPLAELCRQEFMYERAGGDEPVFVFKHALTQDVAYDSLLVAQPARAPPARRRGRSRSCTAIVSTR